MQKKLYRVEEGKMICGVCGGLGVQLHGQFALHPQHGSMPHAVDGLEAQGREIECFTNVLAHGLAPFGIAVGILLNVKHHIAQRCII